MQASIIIPTFNRRDVVLKTLDTLLRQDIPAGCCEIIVVADGSVDGTSDAVRALQHDNLVLIEQENRGPSAARNVGVGVARGNVLIFLDDDMECAPGLVRAHLDFQAKHAGAAGMGPIYSPPGSAPTLTREYFERELGAVYLWLRERADETVPEGVWSFANTSINRADFMRAGGFDEQFRMREDAEIGVRLEASGIRPRFVVNAIAYQCCNKSVADLVRESGVFAEADLQFMRKHPGVAPQRFVQRLERDSKWKRRMRNLVASHPMFADMFLVPVCAIGERFPRVEAFRLLAVRALQIRCGLLWYRRMLEMGID